MTITTYLENLFICAGWTLAALLSILAVLYAVAFLLAAVLYRAGYVALLFKFYMQELNKTPRSLAARLFWGEKK